MLDDLAASLSPSYFRLSLDQGFNHQQAVATVGVVARQTLCDGEAELDVKLLRAGVDGADFEAGDADGAATEAVLDFDEHALGDAAPPVFGRDAERGDVAGGVRLDDADDEADHRAVRRDGAVGDGGGRGQKILEGLA